MNPDPLRRKILKASTLSVTLVPLALFTQQVLARQNGELRAQFKYQDKPFEDKTCLVCLEFIPGHTDRDPGGCKKIPGDDEISPQGYCLLWNTM